MKNLFKILTLISLPLYAQQLNYRLPRDAANQPLSFGVGNPYSFVLTATADTFGTSVRYQIPSTGIDAGRAYRHISVINPSLNRTIYICFGDVLGCSTDMIIVPPEFSLVYEPLRFGKAVDTEYVYMRLDTAGSVDATIGVW